MAEKKLTLKLISEITARINSSDDLKSLLPAIINTTKNVLDTEGCSLLLYDKESDCLVFDTTAGEKKDNLTQMKVPRGKGIAGMVLETLRPEIVNDADKDQRIYKNIDDATGFRTRNLICVPMIANGEVQGVLEAVNSIDKRDFNEKDIKILRYLSDLAAIAIRNRKLIDALETRANELDCLFQISQSLSNVTDINAFLSTTSDSISKVLLCSKIAILFRDSEEIGYSFIHNRGFPEGIQDLKMGQGPLEKILESVRNLGQHIVLDKMSSSVSEDLFQRGYFRHSLLVIPIKRNKEVVGILIAADKEDVSFEDSDIRILSTISNQIAEAFTALRMKEQSEKLKYLERDLQVAAQIQRNSLPHIPKRYGNLEFASYYKASKDIGGDFYDMIVHSPTEISVMIADVSGKGTPAALFMELSKTVISGEVTRNPSPREALIHSSEIIQEKAGFVLFVTVMLIRINTDSKTLTYSTAGHNRQFLYKKSTKEILLLNGKGMPLGIGKSEISEHKMDYEPGDFLILYTDGVTEVMNETNEMYTEERLIQDIISMDENSAEDLKEKILKITKEFQGGAEQHDDYTLFVIKLG